MLERTLIALVGRMFRHQIKQGRHTLYYRFFACILKLDFFYFYIIFVKLGTPIIALYHKDCIDGTTAAAVALRRFPHARLFPLAHTYTPNAFVPILDSSSTKAECYTLDCGLGIQELLDAGHTVTTIDHHIGGKETFEHIAQTCDRYRFVFDNDKSGASLAWSYFFPDEPEPTLITYVEDGDLWRWRYGEATEHVNNYLSLFKNDPKTVLSILENDLTEIQKKENYSQNMYTRRLKQ